MNIKDFISQRLNLLLFISLIFIILGLVLAIFVPNFIYDMSIQDVEDELKVLADNYETVDQVSGANYLYIYDNGESTMLTANGYISEIEQDIEIHLIHWSEVQEVTVRFYTDDFQNEQFVYYIKIVDDNFYVITFADTKDIDNFVSTLRLYSTLFTIFLFIGTLAFTITIFNNSLVRRYSQFDPITDLNTLQAFYAKYTKKNLSDYYIVYHNVSNFGDVVDLVGMRNHDDILKTMTGNIRQTYDTNTVFQLSPSEYIIITDEKRDNSMFKDVLNKKRIEALQTNYEFKTKTVEIEQELLGDIDIQTLINRLTYAYSKIKNSNETSTIVTNQTLKEMELEIYYQSNLEKALKNEELVNYYQVKIDPKTNTVIGAEALSRWFDQNGIISPGKYISIAENTGLIYDIDILSFKNSCKFVSSLVNLGVVEKSFKVSTNFSPITLKNLSIETIKEVLNQTKANPKNISFEITESVVLEFEAIKELLYQIAELGITIEIDDFSAGNSSFTVLPILNASYIKIDMGVLPKDTHNTKETMIYESLVDIATRLDLKIISEGVETKEQMEYIRKQNVHGIQGYYYSRPIAQQEFIALLEKFK